MKLFFLLICINFWVSAKSQKFPLFVGSDAPTIANYIDSILSRSGDGYDKLTHTTNEQGDLLFIFESSRNDIKKFKASQIQLVFKRNEGIESCITEAIAGPIEEADENLKFIKDNFIQTGIGKWESTYPYDEKYKVKASFNTIGEYFFVLIIELKKK